MRRVVTPQEMARVERAAYASGAQESDFMHRAGLGVAQAIEQLAIRYGLSSIATLLCGRGNNAGDTFVAGLALHQKGWQVRALHLGGKEKLSPLCKVELEHYLLKGGEVIFVQEESELSFLAGGVIVDGLFGTGFHGRVDGLYRAAIAQANQERTYRVSVDIPSGVNGATGEADGAFHADHTLYLEMPKVGFFFGKGWNSCGQLEAIEFGLPKEFALMAREEMRLLELDDVAGLLPKTVRTRSKYSRGYVVGLAGSEEMPGAAGLSSLAALRAGAGMVRMLLPKEVAAMRLCIAPEILVEVYRVDEIDSVIAALNQRDALFIGPGLGRGEAVGALVGEVIQRMTKPAILDADALYHLALHPEWKLPEEVILTPHQGEMKRLLGETGELGHELTPEWLARCSDFARQHRVVLVLKGAPTLVFDGKGGGAPFVIARGDPGMATAGSGDVLTGVIAALAAQGLTPLSAALSGVTLHSLAGEAAAKRLSSHSIIASDLIASLPDAFREFEV